MVLCIRRLRRKISRFEKGKKKMMRIKTIKTVFAATAAAAMAANAMDAEFLRELIAIPSVSADIAQVNRASRAMKAYLEKRGVCCALETMPDGREALYASTTPGKGHDFVIAPHIDVVPPADKAQFTMVREGDKVIGRGVSDCKGRAVAVAELLCSLVGKNVSVGCIFGPDEEIGGFGTRWMVVDKGYAPKKMAIVADSGYANLYYAQKGQTYFRVVAKGRSRHSSAPWACDDTIDKMARACTRIRDEWDRTHPLAEDKWSDVLTPTIVHADDGAMNLIPGKLEMVYNLRSARPEAKDEAMALIKECTGAEVELIRHTPPVSSDPDHPLMQRLRKTMGESLGCEVPAARMLAATDARHFLTCNVPVAIVGTKGGGGHSANEYAYLSTMDEMREFLYRFLMSAHD